MLNSGIGPVISKKINKANGMPKKPMTPNISMYPIQMMNAQNKLQMPPNMAMQPNPNVMMKPQDLNLQMQAQQQTSTMKIENVSLQSAKKVSSQIMFNKGMVSSPNINAMPGSDKGPDVGPQMGANPMNMALQQQLPTLQQTNSTKMVNDKELAKSSEIPTMTLRIGSLKFIKENKITTKIIFSKKQFVWEIGDEDTKGQNKRKFELRFSDIEKIDVSIENSSIRIETREKPTGYKEHNTQLKKTSQWVKETMYDTESEFGDDESKSGTILIDATYGKDALTRSSPGKLSHLEKLKKCELPLAIDGKSLDSVPSTPLKSAMSFTNFNDNFQNLPPSLQLHPSQSFMHQSTSHKKDMGFPDLMLNSQPSLTLGHKDSISFDNLNLFKDPSILGEKMPEEDPQAEAEEDEEEKEFPLLTRDKKAEAKKFEATLKDMKSDEKVDIIMKTIKPKRFGLNPQSKKIYKCPLYKCALQKNSVSQLKDHLKKNHKKVVEMGFNVDDSGAFTWKNEHIDFALMVAKIYPKFVKNIVKEAKKMS